MARAARVAPKRAADEVPAEGPADARYYVSLMTECFETLDDAIAGAAPVWNYMRTKTAMVVVDAMGYLGKSCKIY